MTGKSKSALTRCIYGASIKESFAGAMYTQKTVVGQQHEVGRDG
jgi:hypothetical protein